MNFQYYEVSAKVSEICDNIHSVIKNLKLDFTIQQTPYSSYITIRRKVQKNVTSEALNRVIENTKSINNVNSFDLNAKLKDQECENEKLLSESGKLNEELSEHKHEIGIIKKECEELKDKVKDLEGSKSKLLDDFKTTENEKKILEKEKQTFLKKHKKYVHDLKKEHAVMIEKYEKEVEVLREFKDNTIKEEKGKKDKVRRK